jgi:two-component system, chemotaxis family, chemotaxis protein CheY
MAATRKSPLRGGKLGEIRDEASAAEILVVEDDPGLGEVLCELLTLYGYHPSYAADGVAALQMLGDGTLPDLILLDLMMPRMDGWGFRAAQLADKRLRGIPVVVLSAVGEIIKPIEAAHLLRKPVSPEILVNVIERFRRRDSA